MTDAPQNRRPGPQRRRGRRRHDYWPVLLVLLIGAAVTLSGYDLVERLEHRELESAFARFAFERRAAVERTVHDRLFLLHAVSALFDASREVERDEFAAFVRPLLEHHRDVRGLEWIPYVRATERDAFERAKRDAGLAQFRISERRPDGAVVAAGARDELFPVDYVEPLQGNEVAVGFDVGSDATRRRALEQARDTGQPTATGWIDLVQDPCDDLGFLVFLPKYRKGAVTETTAQRREKLTGFVVGVFCVGDIMGSAMDGFEPIGIDLLATERGVPDDQAFLAWTESDDAAGALALDSGLSMEADLVFASRTWRLQAMASREFIAAHDSRVPLIVFGCGTIITMLLAGYVALLVGRTARVERLVAERTAELTRQAARLHRAVARREQAEASIQRSNELLSAMTGAQSAFIASVDPKTLFDDLLVNLLAVTGSEYGFIGEVVPDEETGAPCLRMCTITNIAWDGPTRAFYEQGVPRGLAFRNMETLFGRVVTTRQPVIANDPANDARRGGVPEGHPPLHAFLGMPFLAGDEVVGVAGIANRPGGYDEALVRFLEPLLTTCGGILRAFRSEQFRRSAETALHGMNEELQRANDELAKRNDEILQLTYAITHDLQTPLATLTGSVEAMGLRMEQVPEDLGRWMGRIERSSSRMVGMLNDLLLYAKAGTERLELGSVDLAQQIEAAIDEIAPQAQDKGVAIDVQVEPAVVIGDSRLILRVLLNVVGNAIKYVPEDTGRVELVSRREAETVRVEVRDNGPGIDPARLGEVFKPFKRACAATEGTGLGLAIVERCVGALGGRVWLESDGRTGTTAVIVLPATTAETAAA